MIVRPLSTEDALAWCDMMLEATQSHPAAFLLSPREVSAMETAQAEESVTRSNLHGLFAGDALVGFAGLHLWQLDRLRHRADIGPFFVTAQQRGTGAADHLMNALASRAAEAGVAWLDLWVAAGNGRARAFYQRHDFREIALREDAIRLDGEPEDDVLLTRRLSAADTR